MALGTLHPCRFQFQDMDLRRVGMTAGGDPSLSGYTDVIETSGGGYWRLDLTNGNTRDREAGLAWRALAESFDGGVVAMNVRLCERLFAPVNGIIRSPQDRHWDEEYGPPGAAYTASAAAPLRATSLNIAGTSEKALIGGELFSILHPTWGWRAYRILAVVGQTVTFRTPLREAVPAGTPLEFDNPRCQMVLAPGFQISTSTNLGRYGSCALSMVEDMRQPS